MKIKGEYILRDIAGEIVAVPVGETVLKSNILAVLNGSGRFFWELLSEEHTEEEIISAVCEEYEADVETVRKDLYDFIEYLKKNKVEVE